MSKEILLYEAPNRLQERVKDYMTKYPHTSLLVVKRYDDTPFKDKTVIQTRYVVFLENGNLLMTLEYGESSDPEYDWYRDEIRESCMIAAYMKVFWKKVGGLSNDARLYPTQV
ncbi:hypothetical protein SD70_26075 [Gordoniibacillus kamchatkensis]|uniref:Uncharacterized protein n=1 Tax=Gordoniibacillus kamchatkensis TaxID=1590651 RepID=A0ABR5ABU3_9BACL|nr:hypothetical protein [Paenibacillus sp. VKM B-2647]KIL38506.1 hypothetical protein SD70_26075 [Paenibacillus sp. VKM B-2647]